MRLIRYVGELYAEKDFARASGPSSLYQLFHDIYREHLGTGLQYFQTYRHISVRIIVWVCRMAGETGKHEKFRRLAESRTNKALDAIGRIGNLSNRSLYEWEDEEVKRIIRALRNEISEVEGRFASPRSKAAQKFRL